MAIEVFNRYEKKYLVDDSKMQTLIKYIEMRMDKDVYNKDGRMYTIRNVYYDTENDELIRRSIERPVYKEKLRVRSYYQPGLEDRVFVEIKKKYKGVVNKRRTAMKLSQAYDFIENGVVPDVGEEKINPQIFKELEYFRQLYDLKKKVCITYDRMAYFEKGNGDFRLTFDTNVRTRRHDIGIENGDDGEQLLPEGKWLMEAKFLWAAPVWFTKLLAKLEIYPVSFSKYGTEFKKYLEEKRL